ncbi:MAG: nucleotidyltransferase [Eubacteriaceae bacterium]|uniref:Nucleotidyltransferase n=1 Tax=Candidatus Pseudoramibacter fermentans TaxID=2594427 RepID=A0A6L5GTP4_9FIRM|nr:nucleotidyltransferase [Candidatus Pseudoramibacter fermentans]RRF92706.1 MAG: nucleotidyltransferase [Eubacteriaceae bacterium]
MKKFDNFSKYLAVLQQADFKMADDNEIYRTGVVGQFNLTFELAWKALQAVMRDHGVADAETGLPREMLQLGYKFGFVDDAEVWLMMLKKRNLSVHFYNEAEIDELLIMIRDSFIQAFEKLRQTLSEKLEEIAGEPV